MREGETRQQENDRQDGQCERHNLMNLLGNREYIDEFTTGADPRTTDEILSRKPLCCMPGWKPPERKPLTEEQKKKIYDWTPELVKEASRDIARLHRLTPKLRTGREVG
ncbi:hypothetical protein LCGC14_1436340 [marine sediment metagenome]|uniref:Uncharacterized protein n=1 Tax=marine sediment metagenome TaxID=412755 RepID=A0A0F9JM44_9ZZZZ